MVSDLGGGNLVREQEKEEKRGKNRKEKRVNRGAAMCVGETGMKITMSISVTF